MGTKSYAWRVGYNFADSALDSFNGDYEVLQSLGSKFASLLDDLGMSSTSEFEALQGADLAIFRRCCLPEDYKAAHKALFSGIQSSWGEVSQHESHYDDFDLLL